VATGFLERMSNLVIFIVAVATVLVTPGPTNTLLATSGALVGVRRSLHLILGEIGGYAISITVLTVIGEPFFAAFPKVAAALRIVLFCYLLLLAWRLWTAHTERGSGPVTLARVFVTTLLNPKALIFAFLVFPPIAGIGDALLYAATFAAIVLPIATGWVVFGTSIGRLASRRREMLISRVAAVPLVAFAVMVAGPAIAELFGR
jgi:threonine/homoserine/homoserine lactone efflux protein